MCARVHVSIFQKLSTFRVIRYTSIVSMVEKRLYTVFYRFYIILILSILGAGVFLPFGVSFVYLG